MRRGRRCTGCATGVARATASSSMRPRVRLRIARSPEVTAAIWFPLGSENTHRRAARYGTAMIVETTHPRRCQRAAQMPRVFTIELTMSGPCASMPAAVAPSMRAAMGDDTSKPIDGYVSPYLLRNPRSYEQALRDRERRWSALPDFQPEHRGDSNDKTRSGPKADLAAEGAPKPHK